MRFIRSSASFLNRHRFACVLAILLLLFSFKSVVSTVTLFQAETCGSVVMSLTSKSGQQATQRAALCFYQAHQQCHPATINVQFYGVDTASSRTLSTTNSLGGCTLALSGYATGPCGSPLCLLRGFFSPYETTCHGLSLQLTELDLQDCDPSSVNGPFIRWDTAQR